MTEVSDSVFDKLGRFVSDPPGKLVFTDHDGRTITMDAIIVEASNYGAGSLPGVEILFHSRGAVTVKDKP